MLVVCQICVAGFDLFRPESRGFASEAIDNTEIGERGWWGAKGLIFSSIYCLKLSTAGCAQRGWGWHRGEMSSWVGFVSWVGQVEGNGRGMEG